VRLDFLGSVTWDDHVQQAIREWRPLVLHFSKSKAARDLKKVADCLWRRLEHREALTA
jgi:MinD-like ATPase involved in chromosome partitioning or flagellar assembly